VQVSTSISSFSNDQITQQFLHNPIADILGISYPPEQLQPPRDHGLESAPVISAQIPIIESDTELYIANKPTDAANELPDWLSTSHLSEEIDLFLATDRPKPHIQQFQNRDRDRDRDPTKTADIPATVDAAIGDLATTNDDPDILELAGSDLIITADKAPDSTDHSEVIAHQSIHQIVPLAEDFELIEINGETTINCESEQRPPDTTGENLYYSPANLQPKSPPISGDAFVNLLQSLGIEEKTSTKKAAATSALIYRDISIPSHAPKPPQARKLESGLDEISIAQSSTNVEPKRANVLQSPSYAQLQSRSDNTSHTKPIINTGTYRRIPSASQKHASADKKASQSPNRFLTNGLLWTKISISLIVALGIAAFIIFFGFYRWWIMPQTQSWKPKTINIVDIFQQEP
jgi:hypothetical protein